MLCYVVSQFHDLEKMTICFENFKAQKTFLFYFESNYNNIVIVPITHLYWKCYPSSVSASLCYVMLCCVMLCYNLVCYVMLCYLVLCSVMLCYVMLGYAMLSYIMLCCVMLCYFVSWFQDLEKMTICFENFKAQNTVLFLFWIKLQWYCNCSNSTFLLEVLSQLSFLWGVLKQTKFPYHWRFNS